MGWQRTAVAQAIVSTLTAATEGAVAVFGEPPPSFNVPAYIVAWPVNVTYNVPIFGVDMATLPVLAAVATDQSAQLDDLIGVARAALDQDSTLGGLLVHGTLIVTDQRNWRILADVAGARFLAAELILDIRQ